MKVNSIKSYQTQPKQNTSPAFGHVTRLYIKAEGAFLTDEKATKAIAETFIAGLRMGKGLFERLARTFSRVDSDFTGKLGDMSYFTTTKSNNYLATGVDSYKLIASQTDVPVKKIFNKEVVSKTPDESVLAELASSIARRIKGILGYVIEVEKVAPKQAGQEPSYKITGGHFIFDKEKEFVKKQPPLKELSAVAYKELPDKNIKTLPKENPLIPMPVRVKS